ncbi:hypothetical protein CRM22_002126 [Opisthorchis felineus]|uniref:RING-CH-type domain-containing protein n=1 Tax=Opisthorchis felineus TaxID=147828 RepID=A0A4S2MBW4_OPIFE|nr:hypothetical protein CRM22_002126 [Opisthorchis felineus]TGZ72369.1 hypothetical protein CRM22_002126 [Opisthorchis felineus]
MHRGCLEKWLNASKTNACEICNYEFKVEYAYPSFPEWLKHGGEGEYRARRRHLWTDCVCFVIMVPLMILCAWLTAASARSEGSPIRFSWQSISLGSLFAVLFVVFVIWIVFSIRYHYQSWLQWRHDNQNITLIEFSSQMNPVKEPVRGGYSPLVPSAAASNASSLRTPVRSAPFFDVPDPTKTQVSSFSTTNKSPSVHSLSLHQQSGLFILGAAPSSSCETLSYPVMVHQDRTHINPAVRSVAENYSFSLSMRNNNDTQQNSDNSQSISKPTYSVCAPTDVDHGAQRIFDHYHHIFKKS